MTDKCRNHVKKFQNSLMSLQFEIFRRYQYSIYTFETLHYCICYYVIMKVAQTGVSSLELIQTPKFFKTARCLKHGLFQSNFCIILHANM